MGRKNEGPCITFHLNPARRSPKSGLAEPQTRPGGALNPARRSPKPGPAEPQSRPNQKTRSFSPPAANQKSRRVPAYFSASISSPSTGSNFTPYQWSGSSRVFLMQARV